MPVKPGTRGPKTWVGTYDFALDGGTGAIVIRSSSGPIPLGSVIMGGYVDVLTAGDSANDTATIAVHVEGANDIVTAAAVSGAPWSTTGRKDIIPDSTGSTAVKTTVQRYPTATVAVQALTAGKFTVVLQYV